MNIKAHCRRWSPYRRFDLGHSMRHADRHSNSIGIWF